MDEASRHRIAADAFAEAVGLREKPTPQNGSTFDHLSVLNELAKRHSLEACKQYAGAAEIPWGKFGSLDALRRVILMAPVTEATAIDDFPTENPGLDYVIFRHPSSEKVLFVFTGAHHQFGAPLRLMHQWFRKLNTSLVYVFDADWTYYLGAVKGLGNSVDETVASLERIAGEVGATSRYCLGNSGGGFGALMFSNRLKARRALAFSPPTAIRESLATVRRKVENLGRVLSLDDCVDLRAMYFTCEDPRPARVYYAGNNLHDRHEASNLVGVPNIELLPIDFAGHNLIPLFVRNRLFRPNLDWLVA